MKSTFIRGMALALAGGFSAQVACAAETGFYVGGFYGTSEKDEVQSRYEGFADSLYSDPYVSYGPTAGSNTLDVKGHGYGFVGGYRLFENLAVEAGYMDLGTVAFRERSSGTIDTGVEQLATGALLNVDSQIGGIALSALGILPISYRAEVYGRLGAMFSSHTYTFYYSDVIGPLQDEFSDNATDVLGGVGVSYMLAEVYALRAEFIRVFDAGSKDLFEDEGDVDLLTLGVTVKF